MSSLIKSVFLGPINHIYHAAVARGFFLSTMEGFWEILEVEVFIEGLDAIFGAKLEHFFNFFDGADIGASHSDLIGNQVGVIDLIVNSCWRCA